MNSFRRKYLAEEYGLSEIFYANILLADAFWLTIL